MKRFILTDKNKKFYCFLKHLPNNAEMQFAEIDMSQILSPKCHVKFLEKYAQVKLQEKEERDYELQ